MRLTNIVVCCELVAECMIRGTALLWDTLWISRGRVDNNIRIDYVCTWIIRAFFDVTSVHPCAG